MIALSCFTYNIEIENKIGQTGLSTSHEGAPFLTVSGGSAAGGLSKASMSQIYLHIFSPVMIRRFCLAIPLDTILSQLYSKCISSFFAELDGEGGQRALQRASGRVLEDAAW